MAHNGETKSQICRIVGKTLLTSSDRKVLVVFGDSHAQMWMPAILGMAQRDGFVVVPFGKSGCCTSLYLFTRTGPPNEASIRAGCRNWYAWAVAQAKALHPAVSLISMGYSGITGPAATNSVSGITSLAATLSKASKRVVVMADTPYLTQLPQPVDCLLKRGATMKTCTGSWTSSQLSITQAISSLAPLQHFSLIDTTGWFCFNYLCPLVAGHTIVYRDYGHVTQTYAIELTPTFRTAFRHAVGAP